MSPPPRPARRFAPLLAVLLGTVGAFLVAEIVLRLAFSTYRFRDPNENCWWVLELEERVKAHVPKEFVDMELHPLLGSVPKKSFDSGSGLTTNSRGLRGTPETGYARVEGLRRIEVLGDSFTYGLGVADAETFCGRMRAALPATEVLNLGVNGYGTDQVYLYWTLEGAHYRPDLVVLGFFVPDFQRNAFTVRGAPKPRFLLVDGELRLDNVPVQAPLDFVRQYADSCRTWSRVGDLLGWAWRARVHGTDEAAFRAKAELARALLAKLVGEIRAQGGAFALFVIPHHDFRAYPEHDAIERVLEGTAAELGFPLLDLTGPFHDLEAARPDRPLYGKNGHWNADGHAEAAQRILEFLRANALL